MIKNHLIIKLSFSLVALFSYWLESNVAGVQVFFEFSGCRAMSGAPNSRRLHVLHKVGEVVVTENNYLLQLLLNKIYFSYRSFIPFFLSFVYIFLKCFVPKKKSLRFKDVRKDGRTDG